MDLSEIFGFLIILKETLKILPKNGKLVASIAFLSLLLPSVLFLSFVYFYQSLTAYVFASYTDPEYSDSDNHVVKYLALLLAVEIAFLLIFVIISSLSSTTTILVSAYSYTGKKLDPKDLFSSIKRTWKKPFSRRLYSSSSSLSSRFLSIAVVLAIFLVFMYPNFMTICAFVIFGVIVFIFQLYSSVVYVLSVVVSIVEDSSGVEALGKAEKLVKGGQRLHGFTLNLFFNLVAASFEDGGVGKGRKARYGGASASMDSCSTCSSILHVAVILISPGTYYYIDKLSVDNVTIYYGLFFLNLVSLLRILALIAYTVFYFRCKKRHDEEEEEEM
ncbi:hypothetical protein MIMGU_mgv1a024057mg [Erythranthe guttata]|uniref:Uncharacterized protein n=1 Tax=Erythranthe guttata TaxID=4155 RepID=A0A022RR68_ERYGU|nr:hypothetical protein MIMGU_mgv1a024057mg [Erythranthe guttata]